MQKICNRAQVSSAPVYTSYMNGYSHAHSHWKCRFPSLLTLLEMGLLLLCAAPYNLLICVLVR